MLARAWGSRRLFAQALHGCVKVGPEVAALGGGVGQTIGYVEGREAAQPFETPPPIDAINAALVDEIFYNPFSK